MQEYFSFTEWYHYAILFLWLILLFFGMKNSNKIESLFKPKEEFSKNVIEVKYLLITSFTLGVLMVLIWMFKPQEISPKIQMYWNYARIGFYFVFILFMFINALISIRNYDLRNAIFRILLVSFLMIIYFFSGMFGGLMLIAFSALILLIYFFNKFKNILKLK